MINIRMMRIVGFSTNIYNNNTGREAAKIKFHKVEHPFQPFTHFHYHYHLRILHLRPSDLCSSVSARCCTVLPLCWFLFPHSRYWHNVCASQTFCKICIYIWGIAQPVWQLQYMSLRTSGGSGSCVIHRITSLPFSIIQPWVLRVGNL